MLACSPRPIVSDPLIGTREPSGSSKTSRWASVGAVAGSHVSHSSDNGCQTGLSAFVAIAFGIPARLWMLTTPMSPIGFDVHDACATSTASA